MQRTLCAGDTFELYGRAACVAESSAVRTVWMISAGASGIVLDPQPTSLEGCALVEFIPPPAGAPGRFFVRYSDMLLR